MEVLGQGAMGTVYRAFDTRLRREVAVKVLGGSGFSSKDERRRLIREARAAAPLNHPAIATIFEVVDLEEVSFIVMELVVGETLGGRVGTMGDDPLGLARLGLAAVRGLRAAHESGVVHGDIKPDNLMIRPDGALKILDFGVSRRLSKLDLDAIQTMAGNLDVPDVTDVASDTDTLVGSGLVAGTLAYMPPEQMRGEPVDGRADLYSLAVVLQELATGRRPFEAPSPLATMARALSSDSAVVKELAHSLPPALTRVLARSLSTSADGRPASAQEAEVDFEMAVTALEDREPRGTERRVVVVMPFELLAGTSDDAFLRIALAQAVTHGLAEQGDLAVRPTSAVTRFLDESYDPTQVAAELKAQVVVEGTIQRLGPSLRVQVQVWDAETRATLLSVKRDATMDELFDLQDRLAQDIAGSLAAEQSDAAGSSAALNPEGRDPEAYELYLRAGERLLRMSDHDTRVAIEQLERSVQLDPEFADAWARLAGAQLLMDVLFDPSDRWHEAAASSVAHALTLDPGNPEAWSAQGRLLWSPREGYRNEDALRYLGAACRHHAPPQDGLMWYGAVLAHVGLHDEAEQSVRRALEEQPDDLLARLILGEVISWRGDHQDAVEHYAQLITLDPSSIFSQIWYPLGLTYVGDLERAGQAIAKARTSFGEDAMLQAAEALVAARRGDAATARERIRSSIECTKSVSHQHHAMHYAAAAAATIEDTDTAIELVRRAADSGFPNYPAFRADPHFASLESNPAFIELMEDVEGRWRGLRAGFGATLS